MRIFQNNCKHDNCRQQNGTAPYAWRIPKFLLCAFLSVSLAACSGQGTQNLSEGSSKTQDTANGNSKGDSAEGSSKAEEAEGSSKTQESGSKAEEAEGGSKAEEAKGNSKTQESGSNAEEEEGSSKMDAENKEPVLEAGASDEELLEVLKDDIHVVAEEEFHDTATGILEHTSEYTGKIYQLEGVLKTDGTTLCLAHDAEDDSSLLPLKYLKPDFKEGDKVRITGIANQDKDSDSAAVLEVIVAEAL